VLGSVVIGALSTGLVSAAVSYDYDCGPFHREMEPEFYGYIPPTAWKRSAIFFNMVLSSALLLIIRGVAAALLVSVSKTTFVLYLAGDHALNLVQKIARRDFWCVRRANERESRARRAIVRAHSLTLLALAPPPPCSPHLTLLPSFPLALRRYWTPLTGATLFIISLTTRVGMKVMVDHTGLIQ
jgi:hypothetical protein